MARPARPERNRAARSFRQLRRFHHDIKSDKVFSTRRPTGDSPELWKSIGDELVYTKRLTDNRQVLTTLNAWMRAVSSYRKRLLEQFKSLDLKSTTWIT